jgi:hypothetical protein
MFGVGCIALAGVSSGLDGQNSLLKFWAAGMIVVVAAYTYDFRWGARSR